MRARKRKEEKKNGSGKWAAREEREMGEGKRISFFLKLFSNSFSNFQTSIKQETMHSNHDAQALIICNFI
jgi:hypothetical protein